MNYQQAPTTQQWYRIHRARRANVRFGNPNGVMRARANHEGSTALHLAAKKGDVDVSRILLQAEADPTLRNKQGLTALDHALEDLGEVPAALAPLFPERDVSSSSLRGFQNAPHVNVCSVTQPMLRITGIQCTEKVEQAWGQTVDQHREGNGVRGFLTICGAFVDGVLVSAAALETPAALVAFKEEEFKDEKGEQVLHQPPAFEMEGPLQWSAKTEVPAGGGQMGMVQRCVAYECEDGEESAFEEMMAENAGNVGRDVEGLMLYCASIITSRQFACMTVFDSIASLKKHTAATRLMEPLVARTL